jgi:hypothetical protein
LPLYRTQMLKVVVLADGDTRGAALKGNSPVRDLGFRRLIPSLEQVTLKMPTVTSAGLVMQERGLVLLSQKVAANGEQNHLFGKIHTSAMGGWNGSAKIE